MRAGRRLVVVLGLLTATAAGWYLASPVRECASAAVLDELPGTLHGWTGAEGIPDGMLPGDPSEAARVRRTYRSGRRVAWVSVALFTRQDEPDRRASINRIYPEKDVSRVERVTLPRVDAALVSGADRRFLVAYWRQIGRRTYASELRFRLALMREILFARRGDSLLVRVAVPVGPDGPAEALATAAELTPILEAMLAGRASC
jgi:EpsI family protein